jgi:hypothetical protein
MTIFFITCLSIIVIGAVLYPVVRSRNDLREVASMDEGDHSIRMAVAGLSSAQLDLAIGNLDQKSYDELEEKYILESGAAGLKDSSYQHND